MNRPIDAYCWTLLRLERSSATSIGRASFGGSSRVHVEVAAGQAGGDPGQRGGVGGAWGAVGVPGLARARPGKAAPVGGDRAGGGRADEGAQVAVAAVDDHHAAAEPALGDLGKGAWREGGQRVDPHPGAAGAAALGE